MAMKRWKFFTGLGAAAAIGAGVAIAQTISAVPFTWPMNQNDTAQLAANGVGAAQPNFNRAGQIGAELYYNLPTVVTTGFSITPANGTTLLFLNPAGTLATGTISFPAVGSDGGLFCVYDTQTQTAVTMNANNTVVTQTIAGTSVTALTANTAYCWRWINSTATWYRWVD